MTTAATHPWDKPCRRCGAKPPDQEIHYSHAAGGWVCLRCHIAAAPKADRL